MQTSWLKAVSPSNDPPWELRYFEGRGFCAFALRAFKPGDLIIIEAPTVWVHGHHPFNELQLVEIQHKVDQLAEGDKAAFYELANAFSEEPVAAGIFMTNCFDMVDSLHGTACAMYCAIARLNHSCYPNAQQTHISETGEEVRLKCSDPCFNLF
jgi:hypothetical protein